MNEYLVRRVEAGDIIKPWLMLGPMYEDMSENVIGLSHFEKPGATAGQSEMAKVVEEAKAILLSPPISRGRASGACSEAFRSARWSPSMERLSTI